MFRPFLISDLILSCSEYTGTLKDLTNSGREQCGINPHLPSSPVQSYQLDESISNFGSVWCFIFIFLFLFYFE